jgi:tetratricopeptide (TPR) repeat protein
MRRVGVLVAVAIGLAAAGCDKVRPGPATAPPSPPAAPVAVPARPADRWDEVIDRAKAVRAAATPEASARRERLNQAKVLAYSEGQVGVVYMTGYMLIQLAQSGPVEAYRDALDAFWLCRQLDPRFGRAHYGRGRVYYDLALNDLIARTKIVPEPGVLPTFAPDDVAAPLFAAALGEFQAGLDLAPDLARDSDVDRFLVMCREKLVVYYAGKGDGRRDAGELTDALGWYEKAAALPSANADVLRLRVAQTLVGLGRHQDALEAYDRFLEKSPWDGDALRGRTAARLALKGAKDRGYPATAGMLTRDLRSRDRKTRLGAALVLGSSGWRLTGGRSNTPLRQTLNSARNSR